MSKEQKDILIIYTLFLLSIILNFTPFTPISAFGALLLIVIIIAIYIYRAKSDINSLCYSHMDFMIKTFWVSCLWAIIGIIAAYFLADHTAIQNIIDLVKNGSIPTPNQVNDMMISYLSTNLFVFIMTLGPSCLYIIYRVFRGIFLAKNNYPIPNPQSWF